MDLATTSRRNQYVASRISRGALLGAVLFASGCLGSSGDNCGIPTTTATPGSGLFPVSTDQRIVLSVDRPATVFFTLDGTQPRREAADCVNGPTFCGTAPISNIPIAFNGMVLKYFAVDRCGNQEQVKSATYYLDTAPNTTVDPPPGTFNSQITVTFIASDESTGATVYFTTDGSEPVVGGSNTNSGPSPVQTELLASTQLKWFAVDSSGNRENTKSGEYIIDTTPPISAADPAGSETGSFSGPLEVILRIANDTGTLYYTDNGAIPDPADPQHTTGVPLQATLTLNESTVLRFTSIDKAGNPEHEAGEFNQEVYILDDVPLVFATPPGGDYPDNELTVELTAFPSVSQIFYSLNGGPDTVYNPDHPIQLSGTTNTLQFYADNPDDILPPSPTKTEVYNLGVSGESLAVSLTFDDASQINTAGTTADVDTAEGVVRLPLEPAELENELTTTTIQPGETLDYTHVAQSDGVSLFIIDGVFTGAGSASGPNAAGLKIFNDATNALGTMNPPLALFQATYTDPARPQFYALELFRPNGVSPQLAALATVESATGVPGSGPAQILFVDVSNVDNPTFYTKIDIDVFDVAFGGPPTARPPLLAQTAIGTNALFVSRRTAGLGTMTNEIVALTVDTGGPTATTRGSVTLSSGTAGFNAQVVGLSFVDASQDVVLALTQDCDVVAVDFSDLDNPVSTPVSVYDDICGSALAPQATHLEAFDFGGVRYQLATYIDLSSGAVNATLFTVNSTGTGTGIVEDILPAGQTPTVDQAWDAALLFGGTGEQPVIAISAGADGLWLYDMQDVIDAGGLSLFSGTLTLLEQVSEADEEIDGIVGLSSTATNDDFLLTAKWRSDAQGGGTSTWRIPDTLRERAAEGVVETNNLNPSPGDEIVQVTFDAIDVTPSNADLDVEYWDGDEYRLITLGQVKPTDPASSEFRLRITLRDTNGEPELNAISFTLSMAP